MPTVSSCDGIAAAKAILTLRRMRLIELSVILPDVHVLTFCVAGKHDVEDCIAPVRAANARRRSILGATTLSNCAGALHERQLRTRELAALSQSPVAVLQSNEIDCLLTSRRLNQ